MQASADSATVELDTRAERPIVQLRTAETLDEPVHIELYDGRRWTALPTRRLSEHVYAAFLPALGQVAAVHVLRPRLSVGYGTEQRVDRRRPAPILGGGVFVVLAAALLMRRTRRNTITDGSPSA